jgi:hypothetical protein
LHKAAAIFGISALCNRIFIVYVSEVIEPIAPVAVYIFEERTGINLASDQGEVTVFWQIAPDRIWQMPAPLFDLVEELPKFIKLRLAGRPHMITDIPVVVSSFIFLVCQFERDVCVSEIVQASHKENLLGLEFLDQAQQTPAMVMQSMNPVSK